MKRIVEGSYTTANDRGLWGGSPNLTYTNRASDIYDKNNYWVELC